MQSFQDKNEASWNVELNIGVMEEIKGKLQIDLLNPMEDEDAPLVARFLPTSAENIMLFVNTLFLICEDQCKEKEITSAQFGRLLGHTAINGAYDAFFKEWQDFFQSLGRMDVAEALMKIGEMMQLEVNRAVKEVQKLKSLEDMKKLAAAQKSSSTS